MPGGLPALKQALDELARHNIQSGFLHIPGSHQYLADYAK